MWSFVWIFQPLQILLVVIQTYPNLNLKLRPVTLSTIENSNILKSHGMMAFVWTCRYLPSHLIVIRVWCWFNISPSVRKCILCYQTYIVLREWILSQREHISYLLIQFFSFCGEGLLTSNNSWNTIHNLEHERTLRNVEFFDFIIDWFILMNNIAHLERNFDPKSQRGWRICWGLHI